MTKLVKSEVIVRDVSKQLRKVYNEDPFYRGTPDSLEIKNKEGDKEVISEFRVDETPMVKITKDDLRNATGRTHIRGSFLEEVVKGFNNEIGINSFLDEDVIYVEAIPLTPANNSHAISLSELKKNAPLDEED